MFIYQFSVHNYFIQHYIATLEKATASQNIVQESIEIAFSEKLCTRFSEAYKVGLNATLQLAQFYVKKEKENQLESDMERSVVHIREVVF